MNLVGFLAFLANPFFPIATSCKIVYPAQSVLPAAAWSSATAVTVIGYPGRCTAPRHCLSFMKQKNEIQSLVE